TPNTLITYQTDDTENKPLEEFKRLLSEPSGDLPTAVICYNDELAVKLLDILRERKLKVPEDISIVGYDDSFLANVSEVKLTTVKHPQSELGETAGKLILDLVHSNREYGKGVLESVVFEPQLI